MAPVHERGREAAYRAESGRDRARARRLKADTTIVEPAQFTVALLERPLRRQRSGLEGCRARAGAVCSQPYLENRLVLVGRRGEDVSATGLGGVSGKRIALVEGYSYGDAIVTSGVIPVPSRSEEDSVALLLAKKVDYVLMDELVVQYILENHPNEARTRLSVGTTPLVKRALHLAVRRAHPDAASIVERFNAQLRGMIADRTYHRLLNVSWILADVDGDGITELVPKNDVSGTEPPKQAYSLFSTDALKQPDGPDGAAILRGRHHLHGLGRRTEPL